MRIVTMLALVAVAAACHSRVETNPSSGDVDVDLRTDKKAGENWTGDLRGSGEYGGISGRATCK